MRIAMVSEHASPLAVLGGVGDQAPQGGGEPGDVRRDDPRLLRYRLDRLRRREADDRHPEVHGLQQRQAERGPADRVHVDAPSLGGTDLPQDELHDAMARRRASLMTTAPRAMSPS